MLEALNGWDAFVVVAFLLSVITGVVRGMVRTVFALAAWVVALLGVPFASPWLLQALDGGVPPPVVWIVVFLLLFVAVRLLGGLAARALHGVGLGGADRLLGALLGVVRATIVVMVVAVVAHVAGWSKQPAWTQATSRPLLDALVRWAEPHLPERLSGLRST
ncbi:MAG TPA: CvpA family protein [Burkholderiaceae bacterium]|nr:CvpA family protein [Burkholderiaceae bacterium]